ncbi:MAG: zinc-dependent metalloprotease, partial [Solirubrobacteraceae bacterium]
MDLSRAAMRGLVLGAVAGFVYVASRRTLGEPPRLIQWDRARTIARGVTRRDSGAAAIPAESADEYRAMVRRSEDVIGRYLKQSLPLPLSSVETFDRFQWIDANIASFRQLFEPLESMNRQALRNASVGTHVLGEVNQVVLSGQLGLLLGYLARRVLGQYDTALLGREPVTTGRLYFVEPNIAFSELRL